MSLNYKWFSTMWGVYIFAGRRRQLDVAAGPRHHGAAQSRIFEGTWSRSSITTSWGSGCSPSRVFWAYIGFSQYMLIWYANIPEETEYFIRAEYRSPGGSLSLLLVFGRFFGPFALLLLQSTKKHPNRLCLMAGWIIFMQTARHVSSSSCRRSIGSGVHVSIWDFVCSDRHGFDPGLSFSCGSWPALILFPCAIRA